MTLVKTTILAEDESDEFQPTGEVILQAIGAGTVVIDVEGRVDADAPWSAVTSWTIQSGAFRRLAQLPRMRVRIRGNAAGQTVTVRRSE